MISNIKNHDANGSFAKGHTTRVGMKGRSGATGKQLKQLCIDVLNERGLGGVPLIESVIARVARDKPEALLPFAGKLIPTETEVTTTKFSPIVLGADIVPAAGVIEGVVVEQSIVTTNATVELEPVVFDVIKIKEDKKKVCSINVDDDL